MNTHKILGLLAAVLVTAAQTAVFATNTSSAAQTATGRGAYVQSLGAKATPDARTGNSESASSVVG